MTHCFFKEKNPQVALVMYVTSYKYTGFAVLNSGACICLAVFNMNCSYKKILLSCDN